MTSGRIYAELTPDGRVTTGVAFSNPNSQDATINFEMRNEQGSIYRSGSSRSEAPRLHAIRASIVISLGVGLTRHPTSLAPTFRER